MHTTMGGKDGNLGRRRSHELQPPTLADVLPLVVSATPKILRCIYEICTDTAQATDANPCRLVTFSEAARLLKVSRSSIWRLCKAKKLHPVPLLKGRRLRETDIHAFARGEA